MFYLPAFFDAKQFLNSLIQERSRIEEVPTKDLCNQYEVLDFYEQCDKIETIHAEIQEDQNVNQKYETYIYGLWLEGASWDMEQKLLVDSKISGGSSLHNKFPAVRVSTNAYRKRRKTQKYHGKKVSILPHELDSSLVIDNV